MQSTLVSSKDVIFPSPKLYGNSRISYNSYNDMTLQDLKNISYVKFKKFVDSYNGEVDSNLLKKETKEEKIQRSKHIIEGFNKSTLEERIVVAKRFEKSMSSDFVKLNKETMLLELKVK